MYISPASPWAPWWKPSVIAVGWPVCTDHHHTSTLTTRLWRGCLHEHPCTPPNHDLMPLIYTVSRAYQKVSPGAPRQVYKGLAGTLLHRTFRGGTQNSHCRSKGCGFLVFISGAAARCLASGACFSVGASRGTRTTGTDVELSARQIEHVPGQQWRWGVMPPREMESDRLKTTSRIFPWIFLHRTCEITFRVEPASGGCISGEGIWRNSLQCFIAEVTQQWSNWKCSHGI